MACLATSEQTLEREAKPRSGTRDGVSILNSAVEGFALHTTHEFVLGNQAAKMEGKNLWKLFGK